MNIMDMNNQIIKFAALLYNPRDIKNKNKWKHVKIIKNEKETFIYVYGKPKNKLDTSKFNEICCVDLTATTGEYKKINGGSVRIIINITNNTYKIAFCKKIMDEENWQMEEYDYIIYYESSDYLIDSDDVIYKNLKLCTFYNY